MYSISDEFKAALKRNAHVEHVRGTIDGISFTDANVLSLTYSNRCSDTKDVTFGSAYIGQIEASFVNVGISRGDWRNLIISLEWGLEVGGSTEWIPIGIFTIQKAEWTDRGITVTASDAMARFDLPAAMNTTYGNLFGILTLACQACGVDLGMEAEEVEALPNGSEVLGLYPENDISTWRDLISWCASTVGGYATINRDGALIIRSFKDSEVVDELSDRERISGTTFSDYETEYGGITITDIETKTSLYYGTDGLAINIGSNPLLQYGTLETKNIQRNAVAGVAQLIEWTPFEAQLLNAPVYDLGDLLAMTGGVAGSSELTCCVMAIQWSLKGIIDIGGYGADPALSKGKSSSDKALSQLAKNQGSNGLTYYTYLNTAAVTLGETPKRLLRIAFATAEQTTVTLWHEFKMLTELAGATQTVKLQYYYDGVLQDYEPEHTYGEDGEHILGTQYWLQNVSGGEVHYWEVRASVDSGEATLDIGDIHALLQGQKLAAQVSFDGNIELTDEFEALELIGRIVGLTDSAPILTMQRPVGIGALTDSISAYSQAVTVVPTTDRFTLTAKAVVYDRITEDSTDEETINRYYLDEDGEGLRTTEG